MVSFGSVKSVAVLDWSNMIFPPILFNHSLDASKGINLMDEGMQFVYYKWIDIKRLLGYWTGHLTNGGRFHFDEWRSIFPSHWLKLIGIKSVVFLFTPVWCKTRFYNALLNLLWRKTGLLLEQSSHCVCGGEIDWIWMLHDQTVWLMTFLSRSLGWNPLLY